ncbi:MAG TPA: glycoside hydrolase family 3 N-terminal domain-containing protein [Propionibacteriaceae bacterium]|nr:glycoside hydrolase family 3 N-terminal domain-containing protein [Propionibacteriaceae bacterium]
MPALERHEARRLAYGVLLAQFPGLTVPEWLRPALDGGLAGIILFGENTPDVATTREVVDGFRSLVRASGRPPIIVAADEEGGDVTRLQHVAGSSLPGNAALGDVDDVDLTERCGRAYGALLAYAGLTLTVAPCLDVASEPLNPVIGVRSFGADPDLVARHGAAFVRGLRASGIRSCGKHFPGHGATRTDSHLALPVLDVPLDVLERRDEAPFACGVDSVMTAHVVVPALGPDPATLSGWATDHVRALGITGPIITDALGMRAVADLYDMGEASVRALEAGADLLCLDSPTGRDAQSDFEAAVDGVVAALLSGRLHPDSLRASHARNLTLAGEPADPGSLPDILGTLEAVGREAATRAVRTAGFVRCDPPVVVADLRHRVSIAAGEVPLALAEVLERRGALDRLVRGPHAALEVPGALVAVVREPRADAVEGEALATLLAQRPDTVVVHTGLVDAAPDAERLVYAHGAGRVNAEAVADLLLAV